MATDDEKPDPTVKQLLATGPSKEDLARWFGLPSFAAAAEEGLAITEVEELDPEVREIRARQERALACVDPAFVEAMRQRNEVRQESLVRFTVAIELKLKPGMGSFDEAFAQQKLSIGEPREIEIPERLRDDMKDVAPQALLRDLHRPEFAFDKQLEWVDPLSDLLVAAGTAAATAMATSWKLPPPEPSPFEVERRALAEVRALRLYRNWTEWVPHRQVTG